MKIQALIAGKKVQTISADATIKTLVETLKTHRVGALVVSPDGTTIEGIVSERDVVNALANKFDSLNTLHVRDIMTVTLHTCTPDSTVSEIMTDMTQNRIRHIPVLDANKNLLSIVSIGDIVKHHVDELAGENQALKDYLASGS